MSINKEKLFNPYSINIKESSEINEILEYTDILAEIAKALIDYRKQNNITQKELANILNMKQAMISKLESGTYNATLKMLLKISYSLKDCSVFFIELLDKIKEVLITKYNYINVKEYECIPKNISYYMDIKTCKNLKSENEILYKVVK